MLIENTIMDNCVQLTCCHANWTQPIDEGPAGSEGTRGCECRLNRSSANSEEERGTSTGLRCKCEERRDNRQEDGKQINSDPKSRTHKVKLNRWPCSTNREKLSIKSRSHLFTSTTTRIYSRGPTSLTPVWHRKQVIVGHALSLLILLIGICSIDCQQQSNVSTATLLSSSTTLNMTTASSSTNSVTQASTSAAIVSATTTTSLPPIEDRFEPTTTASNGSQQQQHQGTKLKPVNFTLVDELFAAALEDDEELVKRWRNMDTQFQEGIRSILKLVFPEIVAISQDAKVSGDCSGGILKWILSLRNLRSWAIKMLDATGKPTSGIFEGSLTMFGNHRQCLAIRAPDEDEIELTDQFEEYFRGQFCVLHMRPWLGTKGRFYNLNSTVEPLLRKNYKYYEKTLYDELAEIAIAFNFVDIRMDLCVPSTCSMADIQRVADLLGKKIEMRAKVMRCDIESRESSSSFVQNFDQITLYWLILPTVLVLLTLTSSLLVLFFGLGAAAAAHVNHKRPARSKLALLVYDLSLQGSARSLFSTSPSPTTSASLIVQRTTTTAAKSIPPKPWPLYGLRNLFVIWFVIVQLTVELNYQYLRESLVLRNMMLSYWPLQIIINTSMIFSSLILITGFTYAYENLESRPKQLVAYIGQKYFRLVPSIVTLIMITIVTPTIGLTSPVWKNFVDRQAQVCKSTGYLNLFFLQNFISYDKICLPHTWLFCVELQLILLTFPLVLLLKKTFTHNEDLIIIGRTQMATFGKSHELAEATGSSNHTSVSHEVNGQQQHRHHHRQPRHRHHFRSTLIHLLSKSKAGLIGLALLIVGAVINFGLVYTNQLPPSWFHTFPDADQKSYYFGKYLTKAWAHLTTFVVGLYAGYLCRATIQLMADQNQPAQADTSAGSAAGASGQAWDQKSGRIELASIGSRYSISRSNDELKRCPSESGVGGNGEDSSVTCDNSRYVLELAALTCLFAIIFGPFSWSTSELPSPLVSALYDSLTRLLWSLALASLMIKLCIPKSSGSCLGSEGSAAASLVKYSRVSSVLSHPLCLVLGRLSFLAYLIGPYVHTLVLALQEQSLFPSLYLIFHVILGNIVITYTIALLLSLLIEQPIRLALGQLCRCCFNGATSDGSKTHYHNDGEDDNQKQQQQRECNSSDSSGRRGSDCATDDVSANVTTTTSETSLAGV